MNLSIQILRVLTLTVVQCEPIKYEITMGAYLLPLLPPYHHVLQQCIARVSTHSKEETAADEVCLSSSLSVLPYLNGGTRCVQFSPALACNDLCPVHTTTCEVRILRLRNPHLLIYVLCRLSSSTLLLVHEGLLPMCYCVRTCPVL